MSFTVFLGNLPTWVTADDIRQWLAAEDLVADAVKVIRNHETQESKGFAFVEAPTNDEMQSIIRRFDRAPLEDRLLRANAAQPPKGKDAAARGPQPAASSGTQEARRPAERPNAPQRFCERTGKGPVSYAAAALASRKEPLFYSTPVNPSHNGLHGISFPFNMLETAPGVQLGAA
jgi:RNA recognition motif-containing protein